MKTVLGFSASLLLSGLAACGSSSGDVNKSGFANPTTSETPIVQNPDGTLGAAGSSGGSAPAPDLNACATATAAAVAKPVVLVFAYDQSGSMASDSKWTSAGAAMKTFFTSADSTGISASLTFFPKYDAYPAFCSTTEYALPDVGVTTLPSPAFGSAIDATAPQPGQGGTPTVAALTGAMGYAQGLHATTASDSSVALVMVTDGIPEVCSDAGDVGPASVVAALNASTVPTYVVGVGSSLSNLDQIAAAGGTGQAFIVSTADPTSTQTQLSAAIKSIKTSAISCDYKIPAPPSGETLDPTKVNVQYTPSTGTASVIAYDPTCASGTGWHYDDATNPTRVIACDSTCDTIKADASKVDIVFGCTTHVTKVN